MYRPFIIIFFAVCFTPIMAQDGAKMKLNHGYLELGGRYLAGLGAHYERQLPVSKLFSFYFGVGMGTSYALDSEGESWSLIAPLSAGLIIGKQRSRLELGVSRLLVEEEFYTDPEDGQEWILPIAFLIGYRRLPELSGRFFYKIDFLLYQAYFIGVLPLVGVGLGCNF